MTIALIFGSGLALFAALTAIARWLLPHFWVDDDEVRRMTGEVAQSAWTRSNGHKPNYRLTWPATRTRPWQKRVR